MESALEFFWHHSAESNVWFMEKCPIGENLQSWSLQDSENSAHTKNNSPNNNKNEIGVPKSHIHVNNGWNRSSKFHLASWTNSRRNDILWISLSIYHSQKKRDLYTMMVSYLSLRVPSKRDQNTPEYYLYLLESIYTCDMKTTSAVSWKTVQKIACVMLPSSARSIHSSVSWSPRWRWCWWMLTYPP